MNITAVYKNTGMFKRLKGHIFYLDNVPYGRKI